jgi:hypothetical protein
MHVERCCGFSTEISPKARRSANTNLVSEAEQTPPWIHRLQQDSSPVPYHEPSNYETSIEKGVQSE